MSLTSPASTLLSELQHTKITLGNSKLHGIGVFALQDIPKGCRDLFSNLPYSFEKLTFQVVEKLPFHARNLVETYCLYDEENYFVPAHGFRMIDPVIYLNHSSTPNLVSINEGEFFEALSDIPAGEELLVDYGTLSEGLTGYK